MYVQGNIIDPKTKRRVIGNTATTAVADVARNNQALSASLLALVENNALGYPAFSTLISYPIGYEVFYDRRLWKFTSAHAAGAWNAEDVEEFSIKDYLDAITAALATKANTDGYYKNLVSGLSENLIDTKGQGSEQTFFKRTSCGNESITDDGAAMVQKFLGNSVKFNQLVQDSNLSYTNDNTEMQFTGATKHVSISGNASSSTIMPMNGELKPSIKSSHKYYLRAAGSTNTQLTFRQTDGISGGSRIAFATYYATSGIVSPCIFTSEIDGHVDFVILSTAGVSVAIDFTYNLFDLTAMGIDSFTTTAQVEAWLAANVGLKPYYGYTEGVVLNNKALGVRTIGFNRYNPSTGKAELVNYATNGTNQYQITGTYTSVSFTDILGNTSVPVIDSNGYFSISQDGVLDVIGGNATDTCVHLCWSGYRDGEWEEYWEQSRTKDLTTVTGKKDGTGESVVIFPDGLCKIGDVSDEIQGNKAIKRFVVVPLFGNNINYVLLQDGRGFYTSYYSAIGYVSANTIHFACNRYSERAYISDATQIAADDKTISIDYSSNIFIKDSAATTVEELKALLDGVYVVLRLATPEVYVLDEDFNTSYKVADFGTEEMIPQELDANDLPQSAAFYAVIKYNDDFTRTIANIPKYVQPLLEAIAYLNGEVQGLKDSIKDYAMDMKANIMDAMEYYVYNVPKVLLSSATGAPSASNAPTNWDARRSGTWDAVPRTEGLVYIDGAGDVWVSNGTTSAENWKKVS